jgi:mono/diheme cytochrome c family protein
MSAPADRTEAERLAAIEAGIKATAAAGTPLTPEQARAIRSLLAPERNATVKRPRTAARR